MEIGNQTDDIFGKKMNDDRLVYGKCLGGCWLNFVPHGRNGGDESKAININDHNFQDIFLIYAIRKVIPQLSIYDEKRQISFKKWEKIMKGWKYILDAETFDEVFEWLCGIDYEKRTVGNETFLWLLNHVSEERWINRKNERPIYNDIQSWFESIKVNFSTIMYYGF